VEGSISLGTFFNPRPIGSHPLIEEESVIHQLSVLAEIEVTAEESHIEIILNEYLISGLLDPGLADQVPQALALRKGKFRKELPWLTEPLHADPCSASLRIQTIHPSRQTQMMRTKTFGLEDRHRETKATLILGNPPAHGWKTIEEGLLIADRASNQLIRS